MNHLAIIKRQALGMTPTELAGLSDVGVVRSTISRHENGELISISYATDLDYLIRRQTHLIMAIEQDMMVNQMSGIQPFSLPFFSNQQLFQSVTGCQKDSTYKIWQNTIARFVNHRGVGFDLISKPKEITRNSFTAKWLKEESEK